MPTASKASADDSDHAATVYLRPAMVEPKAFYAFGPSSRRRPRMICTRLQHRRSAGPAYRQALAYIVHSEMNVYLHISCLYYFVRFRHKNADGRGRSAMGAL